MMNLVADITWLTGVFVMDAQGHAAGRTADSAEAKEFVFVF
jgi:hypothetical protein